MGRQIPIAMDTEDELSFLGFLQESADVEIYRSWSASPAPISTFELELAASPFFLHNRAFSWEPQFEFIEYEDLATGRLGSYYRLVGHGAPVIEYSRHPLGATQPQVSGRLYWSKSFASDHGEVKYDVTKFDEWFSTVARWVRRHGERVRHGSTEPWCLPAARTRLQRVI